MIRLSGKPSTPRAYALISPAIPGERPETADLGFAEDLADAMLSVQGWLKPRGGLEEELREAGTFDPTFNPDIQRQRVRTPAAIRQYAQALADPGNATVDTWGYRLIEAQHRVVNASIYALDIADLLPYYRLHNGPIQGELGSKTVTLGNGAIACNSAYYDKDVSDAVGSPAAGTHRSDSGAARCRA